MVLFLDVRGLDHLGPLVLLGLHEGRRIRAGEPAIGSTPCLASFSCISGVFTIRTISALSFSTMSGGIPAGPMTPNISDAS